MTTYLQLVRAVDKSQNFRDKDFNTTETISHMFGDY